MNEHPSFDILCSESHSLEGKTILLGICGSVACVRAPDIARKLMRAGARVRPVMTKAACELISPDLMEWACGYKAITHLSGAIEHVKLAGNVAQPADLLLIAPATANTIGKFACGIDDNALSTMFTTAFGEGIPIIIVPAMHKSMYDHPIVLENIKKLESHGVRIMLPRIEEGKAKIPSETDILHEVQAVFARKQVLKGRKVLVSAGRTVEYIDPVRVITNNSSGKMGIAIARAAKDLGAEVCLIYGHGSEPAPQNMEIVRVNSSQDMLEAVRDRCKTWGMDIFISAAAVGDWRPVTPSLEKIPTRQGSISIELEPCPKILDMVRDWAPESFILAFRALAGMNDAELLANGIERMAQARANMIAINDTQRPGQGFGHDTNALMVVNSSGSNMWIGPDSKQEIARQLLKQMALEIQNTAGEPK
jgi:phosphopantothenoylcysteine decarboxylase/phosphopantothenate--cysteine ligase